MSAVIGVRRSVAEYLRENRQEIEEAIIDRVLSQEVGLSRRGASVMQVQCAAANALDYAFLAVELGAANVPSPPAALISDAQLAARRAIGLHTLIARYLAGYLQLNGFLMRGLGSFDHTSASMEVLQSTGTVFERLIARIGEEYEAESLNKSRSPYARRLDRVRSLLSGELMDAPELAYDFSSFHLGVVGVGDAVAASIRATAETVGGTLLLTEAPDGEVWGWIGRSRPLRRSEFAAALEVEIAPSCRLAFGEPSLGLSGWRQTHRQSKAALTVASVDRRVVRYAEVAVVASLSRDTLLRTSLYKTFVAPLRQTDQRGPKLIETLKAYFATDRNAVSAAARLGVSRQTVGAHLKICEERVGLSLSTCATQLEMALLLDDLEGD